MIAKVTNVCVEVIQIMSCRVPYGVLCVGGLPVQRHACRSQREPGRNCTAAFGNSGKPGVHAPHVPGRPGGDATEAHLLHCRPLPQHSR